MPVNHGSSQVAVQFIKAKVSSGVKGTVIATDEKSGHGSMRLHHQRHLPWLREEIFMQKGIIVGKKNSHARMCVIPTHNLSSAVILFDLFVKLNNRILCERQVHTPLAGMACR